MSDSLDTYDFPYFTWSVTYPESSAKVPFGKAWEFASKPSGPDQVKYTLSYPAMWFFVDGSGNVDATQSPQRNMAALEAFYTAHRLYEKFILPLPGVGNLTVRFASPLKYELKPNGLGQVNPFTIDVVTQP